MNTSLDEEVEIPQFNIDNFEWYLVITWKDKVTVVIWLEGDDPECVNAILGGEMKMHMDIYEEHVEEKNS